MEAEAKTAALIGVLASKQRGGLRSSTASSKVALRSYARFYFEHVPHLSASVVHALVPQLARACGVLRHRQVKPSAIASVELLARLADQSCNPHHQEYVRALTALPPDQLAAMKLDKHVMLGGDAGDAACLLVRFMVRASAGLFEQVLVSKQARLVYEKWFQTEYRDLERDEAAESLLNCSADEKDADAGGYFDLKGSSDPQTWAQVDVEQLERVAKHIDAELDSYDLGIDPLAGGGAEVDVANQNNEEEARVSRPHDPLGIRNIDASAFGRRTQNKFWSKRQKKDAANSEEETHLLDQKDMVFGSTSPHDEDFNPVLFLLEIHRNTSFSKLHKGLANLREIVDDRVHLMRQLVHDHFDEFVNCKDAIDSIHDLLEKEMSSEESDSHTGAVLPELQLVLERAKTLYRPLLDRQSEADRIRHVLAVIKRFQFLFAMPGHLKRHIKAKSYDKVVRDYQKVKQLKGSDVGLLGQVLFSPGLGPSLVETSNAIFQVLDEVHHIVGEFRNYIKRILQDPHESIEEQTRLIGYLVELDCEEDPVWYFLNRQKEWICTEMERRKSEQNEHISNRCSTDETGNFKEEGFSSEGLPGAYIPGSTVDDDAEHPTSKLVRDVVYILRSRMPNLWRLAAQNYSKSSGLSDSTDNRIKHVFASIISTFCSVVQSSALPPLSTQSSDEFPVHCSNSLRSKVCHILHFYEFLITLEIPLDYIAELKSLAEHSSHFFIEQVLLNTLHDVSQLSSAEDWIVDRNSGSVTKLPRIFKTKVESTLNVIYSVTSASRLTSSWLVSLIVSPLLEIFRVFIDCLHQLAFDIHGEPSSSALSSIDSSYVATLDNTPRVEDRRQLIVLSNCLSARTDVLPVIWNQFLQQLPGESSLLSNEFDKVTKLAKTLESMIFENYVRRKSLCLNALLKKGILCSGIRWENAPEPIRIRGYVLESLLELVFIHEEVSSLASEKVTRVLRQLVLQIAVCCLDCLRHIEHFGREGASQLSVEISFIRRTMSAFVTTESTSVFNQIEEIVNYNLEKSDLEKQSELLHNTNASTKLLFECFRD